MQADFYKAFEDKFRGSNEDIINRLASYHPVLNALRMSHPQGALKAIDLGCGRGEWLSILNEQGFQGIGFDLDPEMIRYCKSQGLNAEVRDAIQGLEDLPEESVCLVTGFHIAEHLPFEVLSKLMREALRVLTPDGMLVLETPNPENILVGCQYFYLDPTHARPLPMQLLSFLAEYTGFERVNVLRLGTTAPSQHKGVLKLFTDVSPDYAVIAQKSTRPVNTFIFDGLFNQPMGLSLNQVTEQFDANLQTKISSAQLQTENDIREFILSRTMIFRVKKRLRVLREKLAKLTLKKLIKKILKKPAMFILRFLLKWKFARHYLLNRLPVHWANKLRRNILAGTDNDEIFIYELPEYAIAIAEELSGSRQR